MEEKRYTKNNEPKAISHSHHSLLFLYSILFSSCWVAVSSGEEVVGYGYTIESVSVNLPGKWLSANLSLIKNSTVYGADIPHLNLLLTKLVGTNFLTHRLNKMRGWLIPAI